MLSRIPFLTADWRNLVVINYAIDPAILDPFTPQGTKLDTFEGQTFVSLVAFYFANTKLAGLIPILPRASFEEINLRFYVSRQDGATLKRGVTFIKELVPSSLIAWVARTVYNEPYQSLPMHHNVSRFDYITGGAINYGVTKDERLDISAETNGPLQSLGIGSLQEFILEHYWGYTKQSWGTSEYQVTHPAWKYWNVGSYKISERFHRLYPEIFHSTLTSTPHSVFVAQGSRVVLFPGKSLLISAN